MKHTFLYTVWRHSRLLFSVMTLFVLGTVAANLAGVETTPFFVWGMYSEKEQKPGHYEVLQTTINDSVVLDIYDYPGNTRFYLAGPLGYYKRIKDNGGVDPTVSFLESKLHTRIEWPFNAGWQQKEFVNWYRRYLGRVTGMDIHKLRIDVVRLRFDQQLPIRDSMYLFEQW
jgi:hypothetical protein